MSYELLNKINSPSDLKALDKKELVPLSREIREFLIENVERTGGHLASNLGAVELTVALHRVFDSPHDRVIFDVGHQCYVHKLLTGRREEFASLRTPGGLSGFPTRRESCHDAFGTGHCSTAISAALGFAEADALAGESRYTVCVVGDGAYTGGLVHEALNNCKRELPLIMILNENGMAISSNKGTFAGYLSGVRISGGYRRFKSVLSAFLDRIPLVGKPTKKVLSFIKGKVKKLVYRQNYFEELGLYYMGPIDGHDVHKCIRAFNEAKSLGRSVVVHLKTVKGKGYAPAEQAPSEYHSIVPSSGDSFHSVVADELISQAEKNGKIIAVTAAMGLGTGLDRFGEKYPDRYFDVGIAEAHALTFSAGLAAAGYIPFTGIYSTFLQRGYDSIVHDIALQSLPVKLLVDRAGLATADGATHHGIFDVAFLSHIPNITLLAPATYDSLRRAIADSVSSVGPVAIRYSNTAASAELSEAITPIGDGVYTDFDINSVPENIFVSYGAIARNTLLAKNQLQAEGYSVGIVVIERLKPLAPTKEKLLPIISRASLVVMVEEGIRRGGVAEALALSFGSASEKIKICAIDDSFASPESPCDLYDSVGLSPEKLADRVREG